MASASLKRCKTPSRRTVTRRIADEGGKRGRTRQRFLAATFELIGHEHGRSVRIEEICSAISVSRGTFYNYFDSVEELFQVLAFDLSHDFNMAVVATLASIDSSAERINAAIQHYLKRAQRDAAWGWAMVHLSGAGDFFGAESSEACFVAVEQGIESGEFDLPKAQFGRDLLLGSMLSCMVSTLRGRGARSQPRVIAHHLLRALGVPDDRAREISERPLPDLKVP